MNISRSVLFKGAGWTVGLFLVGQTIRFATNVALTRMLAPELFGLMVLINGLRIGLELLVDVGLGQSVIRDSQGDRPSFYNTVWTLQIFRGVLLTFGFALASLPLAYFFQLPILSAVLPIVALHFLFAGFNSVSRFLLYRHLRFLRTSIYDLVTQVTGSLSLLVAIYLSPSVWGLVWGGVASTAFAAVLTYFLIPDLSYKIVFVAKYIRRIFHFGKWMFLSSAVYFLSMNVDRLYLAKLIPLDQLGIYGLARGMAEILTLLFVRLGDVMVFPIVSAVNKGDRADLRKRTEFNRFVFLALCSMVVGITAAWVDLPFRLIFDPRYHAASQLLSILIIGSWFSALCVFSEASLLGLGKPSYSFGANTIKLIYLVIVLPVAVSFEGIWLAIAFASADVIKYVFVTIGSARERFAFPGQDLLLTAAMLVVFLFSQYARFLLGLEPSFML